MIYSITEGQQAEEYKARKAKEAEGAKKADDERAKRREEKIINGGHVEYRLRPYEKKIEDMVGGEVSRRIKDAERAYNRATRYSDLTKNRTDSFSKHREEELYRDAGMKAKNVINLDNVHSVDHVGAIYRHVTRHPKQYKQYKESYGIFCGVNFI